MKTTAFGSIAFIVMIGSAIIGLALADSPAQIASASAGVSLNRKVRNVDLV